jgi:hypothetical protein
MVLARRLGSHAGAYAANELVRPGSRTAVFMGLVKGRPVHPALSGKTMEFDAGGKCTAGC